MRMSTSSETMKTLALRNLWFANLSPNRLYAAITSLIWGLMILAQPSMFQGDAWSFIANFMSGTAFATMLLVLSMTQLALLNFPSTKSVSYFDMFVNFLYLSIWTACGVNTLAAWDFTPSAPALMANHLSLSTLGAWVFIRGFTSIKT